MRSVWFAAVVAGVLGLSVYAEESAEIKALQKHVNMGSVNKSSFRDTNDQKFELIKTTTEQDEDSPFMGTIRLTVEMKAKDGTVFFGRAKRTQGKHPADYEGKDEWSFEIPHGEMKYPKIESYAIEYGFETNKTFVPVVQKLVKVANADDIMQRNKGSKNQLKIKAKGRSLRQAAAGDTAGGGE